MNNIFPQEFIDFVKSFNKQKGEYSKEELYEIGIKHRDLPKNQKSWKALTELVGWKGSSEAYRAYVRNRLLSIGDLPVNKSLLSNRTIDEIDNDDLMEKKRELQIQQQKTRDERTAYNRLIRDTSRIEVMIDEISNTVSKLNALPQRKFNNTNSNNKSFEGEPKEAVLLLSDLHIGVQCDNFYNKYNADIAYNRLCKLVDDAIEYCRNMKVKRLNVVNLGDMIHGIIHTSARVEQNTDVITQVMLASELLAKTINDLQVACPEVIYRSCSDNHARIIANKEDHIEKENFGRLIDWYLKKRLQNTKVQFMEDNLDYSLGKFQLLNGKTLAFAHGHLDSKTSVVQDLICATRTYIDYICLGHFHSSSTKSFQNTKVFINGSVVGTEQYALSRRLFSEPSQKLIIFDKDNVLDIDLILTNAEEM